MTDNFSIPEMEQQVLQFWREHQTFAKSLANTKNNQRYVFYDGPPFATGLPHHGHLLASTIKDITGRYQTMRGYYVERRFGWDCHGLPVEYEIDKHFGKSTSELVNELGIKGYNDACRSIVQRYVKEWYKTVERIGRWVDMENDYKTMNPDFMESVWWVFSQLWQKGLVYEGVKVVPYSTALATGLSNFEAGSNYQILQDPAITVLVKCKHKPFYFAIWTTTPWTLPANLGICVHPEASYVQVHDKSKNLDWLVIAERLEFYQERHDLTEVKRYQGSELVGLEYEPIFPYFANLAAEGAFKIVADSYVSSEDGTGLVHMAPAHGEDDYRILNAHGMKAIVCPIDDAGCFTEEVTDHAGQYIKQADHQIIKALKQNNLIVQHDTIDHSYPCCPRSDQPLIYRTMPSWFINVEQIKTKMLAANEAINWVPSHIKHGRFGKWLEQARDWAVSRNRVWGTPIPIWRNDVTGECHCIASIAELEQLTGIKVADLHRDVVDELTFSKKGEAGVYRRIPEVLDCWFESGSMPYAQQHYPFENKAEFESNFPADFIAEGLDQTRGWFYTLVVLSAALFDKPAFNNIIVQGIVLAEDGKKMSKRLKNYTAPDELMQQYGADALRLYLINSGLVKAEEQRFSDQGVKEMTRKVLLPWLNAVKFWHTYANADSWTIKDFSDSDHVLDGWILSRLQTLKQNVELHMHNYQLYHVVPELFKFLDDLTNGYIRLSRHRFWAEGFAAFSTLYTVLTEFAAYMAPFAPFMAEHTFSMLRQQSMADLPESIHLQLLPEVNKGLIRPKLESAVALMLRVIILGRQARNDNKIKVKTPLAKLTVIHSDASLLSEMQTLSGIIARELNIKNIIFDQDEDKYVLLHALPNSPVLGKRFGAEFAKIRQFITNLKPDELREVEKVGSLIYAEHQLGMSDLLLKREPLAESSVLSDGGISILLDTELTPELVQEGIAREVVNRIQMTRRELGLNVSDRINIRFKTNSQIAAAIATHAEFIKNETLALALTQIETVDSAVFAHEISEVGELELILTSV